MYPDGSVARSTMDLLVAGTTTGENVTGSVTSRIVPDQIDGPTLTCGVEDATAANVHKIESFLWQ